MPFISVTPIEAFPAKVFLTSDAMNEFGLKHGNIVTIRSGSSQTDAEITTSLNGNYISAAVLEALSLPKVAGIRLREEAPYHLQLGPLVGTLVSRDKNCRLPPYSSQGPLLRRFAYYGMQENCLVYVFSPGAVNQEKNKITGYYLTPGEDGTLIWKKHDFPLPDVVYDRILYRTVEKKKFTGQVKSFLLSQKNIHYFNPKFLNKWETYSLLAKNPELQNHLPVTRIYKGPESLKKILEFYKSVYVKPINGSLGKGIIRVTLLPEGYVYHYRQGRRPVSGTWRNSEELNSGLASLLRRGTYVVQQGLNLTKYGDRVLDIRVLLQKDGTGRWVETAMVARVGMAGSIFPNVAAGGEALNMQTLWQDLTSEDWYTCQACSVTRKISLLAGETLEAHLGTFGEIGLDIGVDSSGHVWIIEINSKPSRKVFPKDQRHLKEKSIRLPLDFAICLAGFNPSYEWALP